MANNDAEHESTSELLDDLNALEFLSADASTGKRQIRSYENPRVALADEALKRALPADVSRRAKTGKITAIVIVAPTGQWLGSLENAVRHQIADVRVRTYSTTKGRRNAADADGVADLLAKGALVVGIASSPTRASKPS
jgi:hypothetical protein